MTLAFFSEVFALLAVQLRATDVDEATIRGYFEALKDLEPEFVAVAAQMMAKQGGAVAGENVHWFPKTSEWRTWAARAEAERLQMLNARLLALHKAGQVLCVACDDTQWEPAGRGYRPCACRLMRRLEVIGRRPLPLLPEVTSG